MAKGQGIRHRLEDLIRIKEALARGDLTLAARDLDRMIERHAAYFRRTPTSNEVWAGVAVFPCSNERNVLAHAEAARALPVHPPNQRSP